MNNTVTLGTPVVSGLKVTLKSASGRFTGTFNNPASGATTHFSGIILQKQNAGYGFFLGTCRQRLRHLLRRSAHLSAASISQNKGEARPAKAAKICGGTACSSRPCVLRGHLFEFGYFCKMVSHGGREEWHGFNWLASALIWFDLV